MYIEQGNLFNSINFNLAPSNAGHGGRCPFMPPYLQPQNRPLR